MANHDEVTYLKLFSNFLKIGATAFGGFMALISIIHKQFSEREKLIDNETILNGISLASVLPGPMAVNVVAFVGYRLKGIKGALISMLAVLVPSVILIMVLSHIYFQYGSLPAFERFFSGVLPAVCAIIFSVAINMSHKNIKDPWQIAICLVAGLTLLLLRNFYVTLLIIVGSGLLGNLIYKANKQDVSKIDTSINKLLTGFIQIIKHHIVTLLVIIVFLVMFFFIPSIVENETLKNNSNLFFTFSGVSVTLFGGGYVFIPMLQELVVNQLNWVNEKDFIDGIALGQITPGPIMISATLGIFLPPALLMIVMSRSLDYFKETPTIKRAFKTIHPAVIGMIFTAIVIIGRSVELNWTTLCIFVAVFIFAFMFKVNVIILIPLAGLIGLMLG